MVPLPIRYADREEPLHRATRAVPLPIRYADREEPLHRATRAVPLPEQARGGLVSSK